MRALIVAVLLLPLAAGQSGFVVEDPADDVQFAVVLDWTPTQYFPAPAGYEHADLLLVEVGQETEDSFEVAVTFADEQDVQPPFPLGTPELRFRHGQAEYRVGFGGCAGTASLAVLNTGSGRFDALECLEGGREGTRHWAKVPKALIPDHAGIPASFGTTLEEFFVEYWELIAPGTYAFDRVPDADSLVETLRFQLGEGGFGDLRVVAPAAIRASNGGPDTFVYGIVVRNDGDDARLAITTADVPAQWDVRIAPVVQVPAGQEVTIPVAVTTRSVHAHGGTETFRVEFAVADDPSVKGFVKLGIHYLDIPQLAGHHPELFVHAATGTFLVGDVLPADTRSVWMNTMRDAPGSEPITVPAGGGGTGGANAAGTSSYTTWQIPMDPKLLIGMDFDLDATGTMAAGFTADNRVPGDVTMAAVLWHCNPENATSTSTAPTLNCPRGDWHRLASGVATPVSMPISGQFDIEAELTVEPYADEVPYVDGSNVALQIVLGRDAAPPRAFPALDPARTSMRLPLNEYRDPVEAAFEQIGTLRIEPLSSFEKKANAGQSVWFQFRIHNDGKARDIAMDLFGHQSEWATLTTANARIGGSESLDVVVRVDVPDGALAGDFSEVFLLVEDAGDASHAAIGKLRTTVSSAPIAPETSLEEDRPKAQRTPAGALPLVLVALAVLSWRRR